MPFVFNMYCPVPGVNSVWTAQDSVGQIENDRFANTSESACLFLLFLLTLRWCVLMTQAREDFEKKRSLEQQKEPIKEELIDKELLGKEIAYREHDDWGVERKSEEMMTPEPGQLLVELSEVRQEKQERLEDMEDDTPLDAWKSMAGSGIDNRGMEDSLLSTFFGDKIERLKEDLSHMIQLELEEMKELKSGNGSEETTTEYASREEEEVLAALEEYDPVVSMEETEMILPDIIVEENIYLVPKQSRY